MEQANRGVLSHRRPPADQWRVGHRARLDLGVILAITLAVALSSRPQPAAAQGPPIRFRSGATVNIAVGGDSGVQSFALADVNKDGRPDIVAIDQGESRVGVAINSGDATFGEPQFFQDPDGDFFDVPTAVVVGDVGSRFSSASAGRPDTNPDIIVADDSTVTILYGTGTGNFEFPDEPDELIETDALDIIGMALANFDGQGGDNDLAIFDPLGEVFFLCNSGDGVYDACATASLEVGGDDPGDGVAIGAGDFNGNGTADVAVLFQGDTDAAGTVATLMGNGNGGFEAGRPATIAVDNDARDLAVGRINSDNFDDVAVVEFGELGEDNVSVLLGRANGVFDRPNMKGFAQTNAVAIALGDLDGDSQGCMDFAAVSESDNTPGFALGECNGLFGSFFGATAAGTGRAVAIGNLNGDNRGDIVIARQDGNSLRVIVNQGSGATDTPGTPAATDTPTPPPLPTPTPVRTVPLGPCEVDLPGSPGSSQPIAMVAGDFDRDGVPDVAVVDGAGGQVDIVLSDRVSLRQDMDVCKTRSDIVSYPVVANPTAIATGYINKDGRLDLAISGPTGVTILLADGDEGRFRVLRTIPSSADPNQDLTSVGVDPRSVAIADFDQDSNADVAAANRGSDAVTVLYGQGDAELTFQQRVRATPPNATPTPGASDPTLAVLDPTILVAADLNGDSWVDLAVASEITGVLTPFLNTQQRDSFQRLGPGRAVSSGVPTAMVAADISRGGGAELVVATRDANGRGSFVVATVGANGNVDFSDPIATDARPSAIGAGDFGAQGGPRGITDVAVASSIANSLNLFIGNSDQTFMPSLDPAAVGTTPMALVVADFDGDELADIAVANAGAGTLTFLRSSLPPPTATPTVTPSPTFTNTMGPTSTPGTPTETPGPTAPPTETIKENIFVLGDCSVVGPEQTDPVPWLMLLPPVLALIALRRARRRAQDRVPERPIRKA